MKKLFISQPMNGKTNEEILKEREQAIKDVEEILHEEVEPLDSFFDDYNPESGKIPLKYLAKSISLLADADVACFVEGWHTARGCKIEYTCAHEYGIPTIQLPSEPVSFCENG